MATEHDLFPARFTTAIVVLLGAAPARAETIDATATVLIAGHADPRDGKTYTVVPAYEALSLSVGDFRFKYVEDFRLAVRGWGLVAFGDPRPGEAGTGDLDLGYAEGKVLWRRLTIRLGRQLVTGGAARMTQLDGLALDVHVWRGLGIAAYGGAPVTPRFGLSRGDAAAGGRIYWRQSYETEVGVSAIDVLGLGRVARQDVAGDLRWGLHRTFFITGYGLYSLRELRLAEGSGSLNWQPHRSVLVSADYRRVAPDLFLPLNSIFSVFSQETRDEGGASLYYQPIRRLKLSGDYRFVNDAQGWGHRGGVKATLALGPASAGVEARALHLPTNGYYEGRLFGTGRVGDFFFSLDLDSFYLENAIYGRNFSFTAAGTAGWDFHPGWRLALTGIGDVTPFVERRFEFLARLVWNHTFRRHEVR